MLAVHFGRLEQLPEALLNNTPLNSTDRKCNAWEMAGRHILLHMQLNGEFFDIIQRWPSGHLDKAHD